MVKLRAVRINKGSDLKKSIAEFVAKENIKAGVVVSAAGSLSKACVRMPGASDTNDSIKKFEGIFEIVSLIGMPQGTMHLHMAFSDKDGLVHGGHLKDGNIVHTTVELIILEDDSQEFTREHDSKTGFDELVVKERT